MIEQAIYERWANFNPLTRLVPIASVWTGPVPETSDENGTPVTVALPYVSLSAVTRSSERTSSGNIIKQGTVTFAVYAADSPTMKTVMGEIQSHFNRADFAWTRGSVLDMRPAGDSWEADEQDERGIWMGTQSFEITILDRGA